MSEKGKSIISYIFGWIGGLIILYAGKENEKNTKIHAAQGIVISVGYILISIVYLFIPFRIPFFSTGLRIIYILAIIFGIVKASKEEEPELPVIGNIANAIFRKKIEEN